MNTAVQEIIQQYVPIENMHFNEPMSKHTTFRTGGNVDCLIEIDNKEQLEKVLPYLNSIEQEYFILGNGSNLLVGDKGYSGIVLQIGNRMSQIEVFDDRMTIGAGALLSKCAHVALEHGLTGMEFASGIPGTLGGALVMNAGAYDGEMSQIVESVTVLDKEGNIMVLDNDTMEFSYRESIIRRYPFVIVEAVLKLSHGDADAIRARMEELSMKRREKQPLEYASAGSTFKRPEGYFAGKLIMEAGLRGYRIGGAQVAEKHCGFIINIGNATSADVKELIEEVQEKVKEKFHVSLEKEVIFLGDF